VLEVGVTKSKGEKNSERDEPGIEKNSAQADDALRWQLYNDHKRQAWEDIQSSTDSYDQGLLTLSSGGLALSIAFIKDIVPLQHATWLLLLYVSWIAFGLCILTTVVSFQIAIATQREHLENCWKFYIDRDDSYRDRQGKYSKLLRWCTITAGSLFVLALACTIVFAVENVGRYSVMSDSNRRLQEGRAPVSVTPIPDASGESRGRAPVGTTPVPSQTPPVQQPPAQAATPPAISQPPKK
jgi:hypothetical protein